MSKSHRTLTMLTRTPRPQRSVKVLDAEHAPPLWVCLWNQPVWRTWPLPCMTGLKQLFFKQRFTVSGLRTEEAVISPPRSDLCASAHPDYSSGPQYLGDSCLIPHPSGVHRSPSFPICSFSLGTSGGKFKMSQGTALLGSLNTVFEQHW